ncbi:MAG: M20/M25/M40 family metallo-hydrolase, partial [Mycobacteriaceae bacterium]
AKLESVVAEGVAALLAPTGVTYELRHQRGVPPVVNDRASARMLRAAVGGGVGEQAVATALQSSGGEDFAWYLEHVPGAMGRLGVWSGHGPQLDLHQPTFDLDERALEIGVRVLVHAALEAWGSEEG